MSEVSKDLIIEKGILVKVKNKRLTKLEIPAVVTSVAEDAVCNMPNLEIISCEDNLKKITANSVVNCPKLFFTYVSENTDISPDAFINTPRLIDESGFLIVGSTLLKYFGEEEVVIIPRGVKKINACAFYKNETMKKLITNPELRIIGKYACNQCINLIEVQFAEGLEIIESGAFRICSSQRTANMPESLRYLGEGSYAENYNLIEFSSGSNLEYAGSDLFANNINLKVVTTKSKVINREKPLFRNCNENVIVSTNYNEESSSVITMPNLEVATSKKSIVRERIALTV